MDGGLHYLELEKHPDYATDEESIWRRRLTNGAMENFCNRCQPMIMIKNDNAILDERQHLDETQ
jgi:hypothetical protein